MPKKRCNKNQCIIGVADMNSGEGYTFYYSNEKKVFHNAETPMPTTFKHCPKCGCLNG